MIVIPKIYCRARESGAHSVQRAQCLTTLKI